MSGDADILVQARSALLDASDALEDHRDSVVVIGAQAIYLHTGSAQVALAEATKDSDLALDVRSLGDDPLIEVGMERANFRRNPKSNQLGAWVSPTGIPVDLMVPEALAGNCLCRGGVGDLVVDEAVDPGVGLQVVDVGAHAEVGPGDRAAALHAEVVPPGFVLVLPEVVGGCESCSPRGRPRRRGRPQP